MAYFKAYRCIQCDKIFNQREITEDQYLLWDPAKEVDELGYEIQTQKTTPNKDGLYQIHSRLVVDTECETHGTW